MPKFTIKELCEKTGIPEGTWSHWLWDAELPREKAQADGCGYPPYRYNIQDILKWWKSRPYEGMSIKRYYSVKRKLANLSNFHKS